MRLFSLWVRFIALLMCCFLRPWGSVRVFPKFASQCVSQTSVSQQKAEGQCNRTRSTRAAPLSRDADGRVGRGLQWLVSETSPPNPISQADACSLARSTRLTSPELWKQIVDRVVSVR